MREENRDVKIEGIVKKGLQNGRVFGFPTANIELLDPNLKIEKGVFATLLYMEDQIYKGMLYVGTRPTLDLLELSIEINIFDFEEDIYMKKVAFSIEKKIRDEKRFVNVEQLIEQLKNDRDETMAYFSIL